MLARPPSCALVFPAEEKNRSVGIHVMTNTSERATTTMTAVFVGLLILKRHLFLKRAAAVRILLRLVAPQYSRLKIGFFLHSLIR